METTEEEEYLEYCEALHERHPRDSFSQGDHIWIDGLGFGLIIARRPPGDWSNGYPRLVPPIYDVMFEEKSIPFVLHNGINLASHPNTPGWEYMWVPHRESDWMHQPEWPPDAGLFYNKGFGVGGDKIVASDDPLLVCARAWGDAVKVAEKTEEE